MFEFLPGCDFGEANPSVFGIPPEKEQQSDATVFNNQLQVVRVEAGEDYIRIEIPAAYPEELEQSLKCVVDLLNLSQNWDSYGARRVDFESVISAIQVLAAISPHTPQPQIVPTARGTLQLEWHQDGIDLEVEARNRSSIWVSYEKAGDERDFEVTDLSRLETILADFTPHAIEGEQLNS